MSSGIKYCIFISYSKLDIKEEIEEEEKTLEVCVDKKMGEVEFSLVEKMYCVASQCLNQMKNRRPSITTVCTLDGYTLWLSLIGKYYGCNVTLLYSPLFVGAAKSGGYNLLPFWFLIQALLTIR